MESVEGWSVLRSDICVAQDIEKVNVVDLGECSKKIVLHDGGKKERKT